MDWEKMPLPTCRPPQDAGSFWTCPHCGQGYMRIPGGGPAGGVLSGNPLFEGDEDPAYRRLVNDYMQALTAWDESDRNSDLWPRVEELAEQLRAIDHPPTPWRF